jgi:hypothetical protein
LWGKPTSRRTLVFRLDNTDALTVTVDDPPDVAGK